MRLLRFTYSSCPQLVHLSRFNGRLSFLCFCSFLFSYLWTCPKNKFFKNNEVFITECITKSLCLFIFKFTVILITRPKITVRYEKCTLFSNWIKYQSFTTASQNPCLHHTILYSQKFQNFTILLTVLGCFFFSFLVSEEKYENESIALKNSLKHH